MEQVERGEISEVVVAHKDRLVRSGFEWFEKLAGDHGAKIVVMNAESLSLEEEMVEDLSRSSTLLVEALRVAPLEEGRRCSDGTREMLRA
jgi:predicted site-specific integrase-resolvase